MTSWIGRLGERGSVALEFAMTFPLLLLLTAGTMEVGLILMTDASLEFAAHDAARYGMASPQLAADTRDETIQNIVYDYLLRWAPAKADIVITDKSYTSFSNIGQPEPVDSTLHPDGTCTSGCVACTGSTLNGTCDYIDVNGNGHWDADMGASGAGGTGDIVVYTISLTRPGFTGVLTLAGISTLNFSRSLVIQNE